MDDDTAPIAPSADAIDQGGDPACWASLLCPNCGAVPDSASAKICHRCGEPYPVDE
jgi:hypothetical protein